MEYSTMSDAKLKRWRLVVFVMAIGACVFAVCRTCLYRVPPSEEFVEFEAQFLKYMADVQNTSLEWDKRTAAAKGMHVYAIHAIRANTRLVSVRDVERWLGKPDFADGGMSEYIYASATGCEEILLFFYELERGYVGEMSCIVTTEYGDTSTW